MKRILILLLLPILTLGQGRKLTSSYTTGAGSRTMVYSNSSSPLRKQSALTASALSRGLFTFPLSGTATTSAGIYDSQGNLVRTLWNGQKRNSAVTGDNLGFWDGKDSTGATLSGSYQARVLTNNVTYTWDGVIGNTSTNQTGLDNWHSIAMTNAVCVQGNYVHLGMFNTEGYVSTYKFLSTQPGIKQTINLNLDPFRGERCQFIAADNDRVYWLLKLAAAPEKMGVTASLVSDDSKYIFPSGTDVVTVGNGTYSNMADYVSTTNAAATGMAVQKTGNFLVVSHGGINEIHVLNKVSGALVQTITSISNPRELAIDGNDKLWVTSGSNTVARYTISGSGTLTADGVSLSGLVSPVALAVSQDNSLISVVDGGTSQQIKTYSASNGASQWTFGQVGGYTTSPTVSNDRFYFSDANGRIGKTGISYGANGDFWVVDAGNYRMYLFQLECQFQLAPSSKYAGCSVATREPMSR